MRYLLTCFLAASLITGCQNNDKSGSAAPKTITDSTQFTTIQWLDSSKDFGKIEEGQKLEVSFRFKNTGDKPLVIERVQPSCGCTVAEQSTEPIAPGGEGLVKASFNSQGRTGVNHKTLFVTANTKGTQSHSLQFVVQVEKKP
ncbi:MAG TPA: DUF1573 domain-containing protein [Puia sp.]